jgi:hypothetical protein
MRPAILAAALALASGPVLAQALPETSRAESTTQGINRSLETQGQIRGMQQQQQFENNAIRSDIQRNQATPQVDSRGRIR